MQSNILNGKEAEREAKKGVAKGNYMLMMPRISVWIPKWGEIETSKLEKAWDGRCCDIGSVTV